MNAVITLHVGSTAHTSIHPLSVYAPHDDSRSETQRVEAPALGCLTGSGGRGSGVARHHDDQNTSRARAPALRVFLRVAARGSDGQMDEQVDQQRIRPAVRLSPPHSSMGYRKHSCPPRSYFLRSNPSCWNSC
ncbi:hypothetical protein CgunFtcFv8_020953 [Champsocephalus gunnari]|uniref:Uncharacterized protein n=1 Tax=Champsocephalus gunnari TaxID=52237 RepID=A0AAN8E8U7_CHAGU|nr:hypothetical protein CgunFtcFv8_020953 [Champsocephalus gunnari]